MWLDNHILYMTLYLNDYKHSPRIQRIKGKRSYEPTIKKNEMSFAAMWMDLEGIMLSEIKSDRETSTI